MRKAGGVYLLIVLIVQMGCAGLMEGTPSKSGMQKTPSARIHPLRKHAQTPPREEERKRALEPLYQRGLSALKKGNYEKAIDELMPLLVIDPSYRDANQKLAEAYAGKKKKDAERALVLKKEKKALQKAREEKKDVAVAQRVQEYTVNFGDILDVSVWQWPDLKDPEIYVRPDGKISFPLVGDVEAVGRTLTEIDNDLTQRLTDYIKSPEVSVSIKRFGGKKIIVLGEVRGPGVYAPTGRSTLLEVVALAGGFGPNAVSSSVIVVRGDPTNAHAISCDLRRALKQGDLSQNIAVEPNDIVYVPRRFISSVTDLVGQIQPWLATVLSGAAIATDFRIGDIASAGP
ncbi:MAG: polysaccharide biosynthesis/export family protein [Candidatus Omnitrophica bacterium]|nr:polysaccharide biosynthesis/export family protein [Candidatus Omnitrophota bacterium]